jgi:hypothetical protein
MGYLTAVQYAGFTIMPLVGSILYLSIPSVKLTSDKRFQVLTAYSIPVYFMAILVLVELVLILTFFKDIPRNPSHMAKSSNIVGNHKI